MKRKHLPLGWLVATGSLAILGLGTLVASCSSYDNSAARLARAPGKEHCVNLCLPDRDNEPLSDDECEAAEKGLEFLDALPIWNMESRKTPNSNGQLYHDNLEKYQLPMDDPRFDPTDKGEIAYPKNLYHYSDDTADFHVGWENWHYVEHLPRCKGRKDNHVLHLWHVKPFREWGGGVGRTFRCMNGGEFWSTPDQDPNNPNLAQNISPNLCGSTGSGAQAGPETQELKERAASNNRACDLGMTDPDARALCPKRDVEFRDKGVVPDEDPYMLGMAVDVSQWEGISFWARRTPNSQAGIRLAVGDRYTDADMAFLSSRATPDAEPYCGYNAYCGCRDSKPCSPAQVYDVERYEDGPNKGERYNEAQGPEQDKKEGGFRLKTRYFCYDPETDPAPHHFIMAAMAPADPAKEVLDNWYKRCGPSVCQGEYDAFQRLDQRFLGVGCNYYEFRGGIVGDYCYDPKSDVVPYPSSQECEDHWMYPVRLSTKWQFYKVPFDRLLQQGWAKRTWKLDLKSITLMRFTWDRGYIDYYIDDVRFYRTKKKKQKKSD